MARGPRLLSLRVNAVLAGALAIGLKRRVRLSETPCALLSVPVFQGAAL
jgi:hypothetical protein